MSDDPLPPDVYAVLDQLLEAAATAIAADEYDTARSALASATTVTENKVPSGEQSEWLAHCCRTVRGLLTDGDPEDVAAAREYLRAMGDRLTGEQ